MSGLLPEGHTEVVRGTSVSVELEAVPAADVVAGSPRQGIAELGTVGDAELGIWELRDGVVTDTEVDEVFIVLSGGATIEFLGEDAASGTASVLQTVEVRPGDIMRLVAGSRTRWSVDDHIRKVYISAE